MTLLGRIFHQGCDRETTLGGASVGLAAGALTGTGLTLLYMVGTSVVLGWGDPGLGGIVLWTMMMLPFMLAIWFAALFIVSTPGWGLLHWLGARCQTAATLYGAGLLTLVCAGPMFALSRAPAFIPGQVLFLAIVAAIGGIVGWVVGRVAYGMLAPKGA